MKRILSKLSPSLASFQIFADQRTRIYSLKLIESELASRFASRCNAAGKVIAIRRETRRGRPVVFAPLASRAPRLFSCMLYIIPERIELEIEQTRSKLIDREVVYKMHEGIFIALRQTVLASGLTDIEKSEMLKEMRRGIQPLPAI
jgi:hypothetical protein